MESIEDHDFSGDDDLELGTPMRVQSSTQRLTIQPTHEDLEDLASEPIVVGKLHKAKTMLKIDNEEDMLDHVNTEHEVSIEI